MIAVYALTGGAVERVAVVATEPAALARLRALDVPAVAFDGTIPVGATWRTTERCRDVILAAVRPDRDHGQRSCTWPGCATYSALPTHNCPEAVELFCAMHRKRLRSALKSLVWSAPAVAAHVVRACEVPRG